MKTLGKLLAVLMMLGAGNAFAGWRINNPTGDIQPLGPAAGGSGNGNSSNGNAAYATNAGTANYANTAGSSSTATQCANSNTATQAANSNTATQCANANTATQALSSNTATQAANSNTASQCANANTATQAVSSNTALQCGNANTATQAANSNTATQTTNVVAGGNVQTNTVTATGSVAAGTGGFTGPSITLTGTASGPTGNFTAVTASTLSATTSSIGNANGAQFCNSGASNYCYTFADTTHITLNANGLSALSFDGTQNAVFGGNITLPSAAFTAWLSSTRLFAPSNGVLQIQNSAGTGYNQTLLLGAATAGGGVKAILAGNNTLYFQNGDGSNNTNIIGRTYYASYGGYSATQAMFQTAQGSGWGLGASDANHLVLISNGITALSIDQLQNAVFSGSLTSTNNILTTTTGSALLSSGGSINVKNPTAATTQFAFLQGATGNAYTGLRYVGAGISRIVGDETGSSTSPGALYQIPPNIAQSGNLTLTAAQCGSIIFTSGSTALSTTLPTTPTIGCPFIFTNNATAVLTVSSGTTALIVGSTITTGTSRTLGSSATSINTMQVIWNGTNWNITTLVGTIN